MSPLRPVINPSAAPVTGASLTVDLSTSGHVLPPDVALLTFPGLSQLQALLPLLPSKHDMHTLACDLKTAWQQDLQIVQTEVNTLQTGVQKLEDAQSSMQRALTTVQASSSVRDSLHQDLISQLNDLEVV